LFEERQSRATSGGAGHERVVHAETIALAVAEPDGELRSLGTIANREDSIRKFIKKLGSPTIAAELGNISSRFESARKLMGYSGVFPSEDSSGKRIRKGGITTAGNAHLRRIVVESAWCYRHLPRVGAKLRKRQQGVPAEITEIAWKAQNRLHKRYMKMTMAGKDPRKIMTAIGRELLGFIWAIGIKAEVACKQQLAA
jgi:transposase